MNSPTSDTYLASIHGHAIPSDVRESDLVHARIRLKGSDSDFVSVRVWRLSPLGIELVQSGELAGLLSKGTRLDLQIVVEGRRSEFPGHVVSTGSGVGGLVLCGIRFLSESSAKMGDGGLDSRTAMRFICSEHHFPKAIAPSPGRFNEFIGFQIRNISQTGMMLATHIENSFLIPKMQLTLSVNLPMVGETIVNVKIVWMRIGADGASDVLEIGTEMQGISNSAKLLLGQYLVQFAQDVSLEALMENGFTSCNVAQGIEFHSLKTESEYDELLQLRSDADHLGRSKTTDYADEEDRMCRLIVGRIGGEAVIACRIHYPEFQGNLYCETFLDWDDSLPRVDQLIEVFGVVCSLGGRHVEDARLALFRYICTACTSELRQNVLVHTTAPAIFESIGWKKIGANGMTSALLGNAYDAIKGKSTNPIRWNYVWRDSALFLLNNGALHPVGAEAVIFKIYLALGPLSSAFYRLKRFIQS